jgi:hypothetical protein
MIPRGHRLQFAGVAQLVEQGTHKPWVTGSSPVAGISNQPRWFAIGALLFGRFPPLLRYREKEGIKLGVSGTESIKRLATPLWPLFNLALHIHARREHGGNKAVPPSNQWSGSSSGFLSTKSSQPSGMIVESSNLAPARSAHNRTAS